MFAQTPEQCKYTPSPDKNKAIMNFYWSKNIFVQFILKTHHLNKLLHLPWFCICFLLKRKAGWSVTNAGLYCLNIESSAYLVSTAVWVLFCFFFLWSMAIRGSVRMCMSSDKSSGASADTAAGEDGYTHVPSSPSPLDIQQKLSWTGKGRKKVASLLKNFA